MKTRSVPSVSTLTVCVLLLELLNTHISAAGVPRRFGHPDPWGSSNRFHGHRQSCMSAYFELLGIRPAWLRQIQLEAHMAENGIDEIVMLSDRAEDVSKAGEVLEHLYGKLRRCMKRDNFRCVPFPPCIHGTCQIRNAPHNPDPVMRGTGKEFYCACPTGFEGFTCERDVDECATDLHDCNSSQVCNNTYGSFTCRSFGPLGNEDIDECATNQHNCPITQVCKNTVGSFVCKKISLEVETARLATLVENLQKRIARRKERQRKKTRTRGSIKIWEKVTALARDVLGQYEMNPERVVSWMPSENPASSTPGPSP